MVELEIFMASEYFLLTTIIHQEAFSQEVEVRLSAAKLIVEAGHLGISKIQ